MADMADSLLDVKETRKIAEIVEKVISKANNKHIHVYTIIEEIITKATTKHTPNVNTETTTPKNPKASRNNMPSSMWEMYTKQQDNQNKLPVEIPDPNWRHRTEDWMANKNAKFAEKWTNGLSPVDILDAYEAGDDFYDSKGYDSEDSYIEEDDHMSATESQIFG